MLVSTNQLDEIKEMLNGLYAKDKTLSTQQELLEQFGNLIIEQGNNFAF